MLPVYFSEFITGVESLIPSVHLTLKSVKHAIGYFLIKYSITLFSYLDLTAFI